MENKKMKSSAVFLINDDEVGVCLNCPRLKDAGPYARDANKLVLLSCANAKGLIYAMEGIEYNDCVHYKDLKE